MQKQEKSFFVGGGWWLVVGACVCGECIAVGDIMCLRAVQLHADPGSAYYRMVSTHVSLSGD